MKQQKLRRVNINRFLSWLGRAVYKIIDWRTSGQVPPHIKKAVVIVAHHTSNWDFPVGLMASFSLRLKGFWVGKHTLFRRPMGGVMRWLGGIPIDRRSSKNFVEQAVQFFKEREEFFLVITPEGTRKRVDRWKTGFYHIAKGARVPIICAFIDFKRKVSGIGPIIMPSDDMVADMTLIRDFYLDIGAKRPENVGDIDIIPRES